MAATARPAGDRVIVTGRPERVAVVRAFAAALLGAQHPQADTVMLCRHQCSLITADRSCFPAVMDRRSCHCD